MRWTAMCLVVLATCTGVDTDDSIWTERASMGVSRSEHPAVVLDGKVVVMGGFIEGGFGRVAVTGSVEAYDPATDTWEELTDLPEPRHHVMATVVDDRMFVLGGLSDAGDPSDDVWELMDGDWLARAPIPVVLGAAATVTLDDMVYLVGGAPSGGLIKYDPRRDEWETLRGPSVAREHVAAVGFRGEIWVIGGRWQGEAFASTEIYDPVTGSWREGPRLIEPRSGFGATVFDDSILVAGGEIPGSEVALVSVESLGPAGWTIAGELPFGLHGHPLTTVDGVIYLPGGSTRAGAVDNPGTLLAADVGDLQTDRS